MRIIQLILIWTILTDSYAFCDIRLSSLCFLPVRVQSNMISVICKNQSRELHCGQDGVILINQIFYKKKKVDNAISCVDCSGYENMENWNTNQMLFKIRLYEACSKKRNCSIDFVEMVPKEETDSDFVWYALILYECVATGLFKDMCSSWETTLERDPLYLTLKHRSLIHESCTCFIEGGMTLGDIVVVDYRPYYTKYICANSAVYVDGELLSKCSDTSDIGASIYNTPINVTTERVNVTISIQSTLPQMIWIRVEGFHGTVLCTSKGNGSEQLNTSVSTYTTTSATMQTTPSAKSNTEINTSVTHTTPSSDLPYNGTNSNRSILTTSTIAGASAGLVALLVIIVICAYVVLKRRSRRMSQTKIKENVYNEVQSDARTSKRSNMHDVINKSYKTGIEMTDITSTTPSDCPEFEEVATNNIYSEPVDAIADDVNAEPAEVTGHIQNLRTVQRKDSAHNYQEPYDKTLFITDYKNKYGYTDVIKDEEKKDVYNALSGIDNYSHIHVLPDNQAPKLLDNYSHIKPRQSKENEITQARSADMYSHFKVDNNPQDVSGNVEYHSIKGDNTNVETEEYDHLAHYCHH